MTLLFNKTALAVVLTGAFAGATFQANAAAFSLQEQSTSGLGTAYASGAAEGADASSMFYNPATLSLRKSAQVVTAVHLATPSMKFKDENSQAAFNQPLGNEGGDAGSSNVLGNFYAALPINSQWVVGLGIGSPYGLVTDYNPSWAGRYLAIRSEVETVNVNPAISFKPTEALSLGLGVNWQYLNARFTNQANYSVAMYTAANTAFNQGRLPIPFIDPVIDNTGNLSSTATVKGDDTAWGWNAGILYEFNRNARIGLSYRSEIHYHVDGSVKFDQPSIGNVPAALAPIVASLANSVNNALYDGKVTANITMPQTANASLFYKLTPALDLMADVQWTGWSSIKNLTFDRVDGDTLQSTPENFKNVWRLALGGNYHFNDNWLLRAGVAYDQTPVQDAYRTPRLPDADRYWFAVGGQYAFNKQAQVDAGFAYLYANDVKIHDNGGRTPANGLVDGTYKVSATVASLQFTYAF